jgi:hypothetical protein
MKSINEPQAYGFEGMTPGSINEPVVVPGAFAPKITSLVPNSCPIGGPDVVVTVTGTGFFGKSVCFVAGLVRSTAFNADKTFKPATRTRGTVPVVVRKGAYSSNAFDFTFT